MIETPQAEFTFDQIAALLPYEYPWLFVDRIVELKPGEKIVALKNISGNEWMFPGHFPGQSVYPGVLLVESMAQAATLLLHAAEPKRPGKFLLAGVRARFLRVVVPGDQLVITCVVEKHTSNAAVISAEVAVQEQAAARATLTVALQQP